MIGGVLEEDRSWVCSSVGRYSPSLPASLGLIPAQKILGVVPHAYNQNTWEVEAGRSESQRCLLLYRELGETLGEGRLVTGGQWNNGAGRERGGKEGEGKRGRRKSRTSPA